MMILRRIIPICLLAPILFAARCAAQAAPTSQDYTRAPGIRALLHWEHFPLHIFFPVSRLATRERRSLVLAGFDEWVHATRGVVRYQVVPEEAQADVTVAFTSHPSASSSTRLGGLTTLAHVGAVLKKAAMQIAERNEDPAIFQATAAHEFGHALGIDGHSDDPDDMMFPVIAFSHPLISNEEHDPSVSARTVTRRDLNTLRAAYPAALFPPENR